MVDTTDTRCALVCMMVTNPGGEQRPEDWKKQVNDLIRALRDERNAGAKREAELLKALDDCIDTIALSERVPLIDPNHGAVVERLGQQIGFGALMSSASASWRAELGKLAGGEHTVGPCHVTVVKTLERARKARHGGKVEAPVIPKNEALPAAAGDITYSNEAPTVVLRVVAGAMRYRTGGDIGHPELVLQQQFEMHEVNHRGSIMPLRTEWRDVPVVSREEEPAGRS